MTSQEVVNLCSTVRLGVALGFVELPGLRVLNELLIVTQPAHLQRRVGRALEAAERNARRASLVRETLARSERGAGPEPRRS